jgi:hypothetical protein
MSQLAQFQDYKKSEVLIRIEQHPWLLQESFFPFLVLTDVLVDFFRIGCCIL